MRSQPLARRPQKEEKATKIDGKKISATTEINGFLSAESIANGRKPERRSAERKVDARGVVAGDKRPHAIVAIDDKIIEADRDRMETSYGGDVVTRLPPYLRARARMCAFVSSQRCWPPACSVVYANCCNVANDRAEKTAHKNRQKRFKAKNVIVRDFLFGLSLLLRSYYIAKVFRSFCRSLGIRKRQKRAHTDTYTHTHT